MGASFTQSVCVDTAGFTWKVVKKFVLNMKNMAKYDIIGRCIISV